MRTYPSTVAALDVIERDGHLEVRSPMRTRMRLLFAALALVPLLAPYDLLIASQWEFSLHPVFLLAVLVSAGAVAVSALLLYAAVAGLSSRMSFDGGVGTFRYIAGAPVVKRHTRTQPLTDVRGVEVGVRDWSDGSPSYHLRITVVDGTVLTSGASWSREEIEAIRGRVERILEGVAVRIKPVRAGGTDRAEPGAS